MPEKKDIIIYDAAFFVSYHVTGVISNTANGIIYRAKRVTDQLPVVIKQIAKKSIKYYYQIHGQPCPAEFVYHFTASAGPGSSHIVRPIEWIEGNWNNYCLIHKYYFYHI